jgi:hypothetical protein
MSYKQAVLRDDPISYWPLSGISTVSTYATLLLNYATYAEYAEAQANYGLDVGSAMLEDIAPVNNHASFSLGNPLFTDVLPLVTKDFTDSNVSSCKIFDTSEIKIHNNGDPYKMFYRGTESKTFGIEFVVAFDDNWAESVNLFSIKSIGLIDVLDLYKQGDTIYLTLQGIDLITGNAITHTTKKQIQKLDEKLHIFALYSNKSIVLYINGSSDENVAFNDRFTFKETTPGDVYAIMGPAPTGKSFTVSDLAVYDKNLTSDEIKFHMSWMNKDNKPEEYSQQGDAFMLDIRRKESMYAVKKELRTIDDYNAGSHYLTYASAQNNKVGIALSTTTAAAAGLGIWYYNLPIPAYDNFVGVDISWDTASPEYVVSGAEYVKVSASYDGGTAYYEVQNNRVVPNFLAEAIDSDSSNLLIKVELYSPDTSLAIQPRIDNLSIYLYKNIDIIADAGGFYITPHIGTYTLSKDEVSIISRSRNLGVTFVAQTSGGTPGVAKILSNNATTYKSVEFWFRTNGTGGALYDSGTGTLHLYLEGGVLKKNLPSGGKVYINGINVTSTDYTIMTDQAYHCFVTYSTARSGTIYINGAYNGSKTPLDASYGYIVIYSTEESAAEIADRYLTYLTSLTSSVNDGTSFGSIVELGSATTSVNGGESVIARPHVY